MAAKELTVHKERFEQLCWMLNTLDARRASLENRAAITVSMTALLFGGFVFLMQTTLPDIVHFSAGQRIFLAILVSLSILLLTASLVSSTLAIANVYKTSSQKFRMQMPQRLFFYPRETFTVLKNFAEYQGCFLGTSKEQMTKYMLGELWVISREYHDRYRNLRTSIRLLILAITTITLSIATLLQTNFN